MLSMTTKERKAALQSIVFGVGVDTCGFAFPLVFLFDYAPLDAPSASALLLAHILTLDVQMRSEDQPGDALSEQTT